MGTGCSPGFFEFSRGKAAELAIPDFAQLQEMWRTVAVADIDQDGRKDLVMGNVGENFYLKPDSLHPVRLWMLDFDANGTAEQFMTRQIDGKDMPVFLKREITEQFPSLKKANLKHADYAPKTIQELFGQETIRKAQRKEFRTGTSVIAYNRGNNRFDVKPLPAMTQLSSIQAIAIADVNADQRPDIIAAGNFFHLTPQFGRLDGSFGHLLINQGHEELSWEKPARSGMQVDGEVRHILPIPGSGGMTSFLLIRNNAQPVWLQVNQRSLSGVQ